MPGDSKIFGVIPARFNSTRLPGKPLVDIYGKPMIYWVAKRVEASDLTSYCVATDDQRITDACDQYDIPWMMTSDDCVNGTERVAEVAQKTDSDYYVNIQGDEPIINPDAISQIVSSIGNIHDPQFIQAIAAINDPVSVTDISIVKVAVSGNNEAIYYSRSPIPYPRSLKKDIYYRCLGLYLYSREFLGKYVEFEMTRLEQIEQIEQLRVLENGIQINTITVDDVGLSIDTPEDLAFVRTLNTALFL